MVYTVRSKYKSGAPKNNSEASGRARFIDTEDPLYPKILNSLDSCAVNPATRACTDFMTDHLIELSDLRDFVKQALSNGRYENSQWCEGNAPSGIYACDSYAFSAPIYSKHTNAYEISKLYIKLCLTTKGNALAVISFHDSYDRRQLV